MLAISSVFLVFLPFESLALCHGPVDAAEAKKAAIAFFASQPFADRFQASPVSPSTAGPEYWFLFRRLGLQPTVSRIISSQSAQVFVHRQTGCVRHQRW